VDHVEKSRCARRAKRKGDSPQLQDKGDSPPLIDGTSVAISSSATVVSSFLQRRGAHRGGKLLDRFQQLGRCYQEREKLSGEYERGSPSAP